jgi:hypothetical protein
MEAQFNSFFEQAFSNPRSEDPVTFASLLVAASPNPAQISWIRHQIFEHAKQNTNPPIAQLILDKTEQLITTLEETVFHTQGTTVAVSNNSSPVAYGLFFPDDESSFEKLYHLLRSARSSLDICVFTITDDRIANSILEVNIISLIFLDYKT